MQVCLHGCELHVEGSVNRTEMHGALRRAQRVYMSPRTLGRCHRFHVDAKDMASSGFGDVKAQSFIPAMLSHKKSVRQYIPAAQYF